jgi:hypothetical protein
MARPVRTSTSLVVAAILGFVVPLPLVRLVAVVYYEDERVGEREAGSTG